MNLPKKKALTSGSTRENTAYLKTGLHWQKDLAIYLGYKLIEGHREVVEEIWCKTCWEFSNNQISKNSCLQKMLVTFLLVERNLTSKYLLVDSKLKFEPWTIDLQLAPPDTLGTRGFLREEPQSGRRKDREKRWENLSLPVTVDWSYCANRF